MKIKLTSDEARNIIVNYLKLPDDTQVTITNSRIRKPKGMPADLQSLIEDMDTTSSDKITLIKRFRETVKCSLIEAKWSAENWPKVKAFLLEHKVPPSAYIGIYGHGGFKLVK